MSRNRPPSSQGMPSWTFPGIIIALILAAGVAFAGYEIGHGSSSAQPTSTPTPTLTPTPTPTPAVLTPTPAPTSTPGPTATVVPTATLVPTPTPQSVRAADKAVIRAQGYRPGQYAWSGDGQDGRIWAWIGTCADSGDGYCQKVFFFHNTTYLGTDTRNPSTQIMVVIGEGNLTPGISVQYANYKGSDALCCPSGKPVSILYTWNGTGMTASGTPPGQ